LYEIIVNHLGNEIFRYESSIIPRKNEELSLDDVSYVVTNLKYIIVDRGNDQRKLASAIIDVATI
jgi:hypothetical protein